MNLSSLIGRLHHGVTEDRRKQVLAAPADFNRAARREVGVTGRVWRWDPQMLGVPQNLPPRYARRHWNETSFTHPTTRRQRRHKARILRVMRAGM